MKGCWIDTYYVKRDEPLTKYHDSYSLHTYNEFELEGPNTWKGHFGPYLITIIQQYRTSEITNEDITIEKDPKHKEDPNIVYAFPSKKDIAEKLNGHLDEIYR